MEANTYPEYGDSTKYSSVYMCIIFHEKRLPLSLGNVFYTQQACASIN